MNSIKNPRKFDLNDIIKRLIEINGSKGDVTLIEEINLQTSNDKFEKKTMKALSTSLEKIAEINLNILSSKDTYAKELYFVLLASVAEIDGEINNEERIFLSALIKGSKLNCNVSKIIDKSITAEKELIIDFFNCFGKDKLKYNFILNSLMMARIDDKINDKEASIIAELAEILEITKEEIMFLAELALAIMEKNIERFHTLVTIKPDNIDFIQFKDHLHSFIKIPNVKYVNSNVELEDNELIGNLIIEIPIICNKNLDIKNAIIFFTPKGKITFTEEISVKIIKIDAINSEFIFDKCNNIVVTDSTFKNNKNKRPLTYNCCQNGIIEKSNFENCDLFFNKNKTEINAKKDSGSAIYAYKSNINFKKNCFDKCFANYNGGAVYIYDEYDSSEYWNKDIKRLNISECTFNKCSSNFGDGGGLFIKAYNTYAYRYHSSEEKYDHYKYRELSLYNIYDSKFTNCSAINGGGLWIDQPNAECDEKNYEKEFKKSTVIYNTQFENCTAKENGGGIWIAWALYAKFRYNNGSSTQYYCYSTNTKFIKSDIYIDYVDFSCFNVDFIVDRHNNTYIKSGFYCLNNGKVLIKVMERE